MTEVADRTAATATNLKGRVDDGVWLHLLPDPARTLLLGRIPRQLADQLLLRGSLDRTARGGTAYDLVVLDPRRSRRIGSDAALRDEVLSRVRAGGWLLLLAPEAEPPSELPVTLLRLREGRIVHAAFPPPTGPAPRAAALLVGPVAGGRPDPVPAHLGAGTRTSGDRRMEIRDGGRYRTKKVVFLLPDHGPGILVKAVRDPRDNDRLANAARTLEQVRDAVPWPEAVPRPLFLGQRHGRAYLVMELLEGTPFEEVLARDPERAAERAIARVVELGTATAHRTDPAVLRDRLGDLHDRFVRTFRPVPAEAVALARHVDALQELAPGIPSVVHHGDLGAWNLLVGPDGSVQLLDWEAGDLHGPPLWDLFYLVRSIASRSTTATARRRRERAYADLILADTPLARSQAGAVRQACAETDVPVEAVVPLLATCWMHRAVKQSSRLPVHRVHRSTAYRVLRLVLTADDAPGLGLLAARRDPCAS